MHRVEVVLVDHSREPQNYVDRWSMLLPSDVPLGVVCPVHAYASGLGQCMLMTGTYSETSLLALMGLLGFGLC